MGTQLPVRLQQLLYDSDTIFGSGIFYCEWICCLGGGCVVGLQWGFVSAWVRVGLGFGGAPRPVCWQQLLYSGNIFYPYIYYCEWICCLDDWVCRATVGVRIGLGFGGAPRPVRWQQLLDIDNVSEPLIN